MSEQDDLIAANQAEIDRLQVERANVCDAVRKLQAQLTGADKFAPGYRRWREQTHIELAQKQGDAVRLKGLLHSLHMERDQLRKNVRAETVAEVGDVEGLRKQTSALFYRLCDAMKAMEKQISELIAENQALREKLGRMELESISAPLIDPTGEEKIDAWRDETR